MASEVTSQRINASGTSLSASITWPSTPAVGNLMVVCLLAKGQSSVTPTAPSGYLIATQITSALGHNRIIYYKIAGASEPLSPTWTLNLSSQWIVIGSVWNGPIASPLDKVGSQPNDASANQTQSVLALTQAQELVILMWNNTSGQTYNTWDLGQVVTGYVATANVTMAQSAVIVNSTSSVTYSVQKVGSTIADHLYATFKLPLTTANVAGTTTITTTYSATMTAPVPVYTAGAKFRNIWGTLEAYKAMLINAISAKQKYLTEQSHNVINPNFENGTQFWTPDIGWAVTPPTGWTVTNYIGTVVPIQGNYFLSFYNVTPAGGGTYVLNQGRFACSQGKRIKCSMSYWKNSFTATGGPEIWFYDSAGNFLSKDGQVKDFATAGVQGAWKTIYSIAIAPANAAYCCAALRVTTYVTGAGYFDKVELSADSATGDPSNTGNMGSRWNGLTLSYTCPSSGTTQTINATAATLVMGDASVSYNASSTTVTQARGTTATYYLYYVDPTYLGGSKAMNVSTDANDLINDSSNVWLGTITVIVPATATTGTGGGDAGGGCVASYMWLDEGIRAGSVRAGSLIECSTPFSFDSQMLRVQKNILKIQPCFRLVSESGAAVVASESTPMTLRDGSVVPFTDMEGKEVLVKDESGTRWEAVKSLVPVNSPQPVAHISVNDNCYFAGEDASKRIATHNTYYKP